MEKTRGEEKSWTILKTFALRRGFGSQVVNQLSRREDVSVLNASPLKELKLKSARKSASLSSNLLSILEEFLLSKV